MKLENMTRFAILLAIEAIVCFTPLGSLPALGPIVMTLAMIPVIITGITMGMKYGSLMGFCAGLFSFLVWTFMPPSPIAFVFTPFYSVGEASGNFFSLLICFVPRILTGTVAGSFYHKKKMTALQYGFLGFLSSMTNTLLVMLGIAIFFGDLYASFLGQSLLFIVLYTILTSGIPEALLAFFTTVFIVRLKR